MNDFNWAYTDKVKEHFTNPQNILKDEKAFQEDGRGLVGNIQCGDQMLMLLKINKDNETITDCKWKTYGCASAIASTSILSEMVIGKTLEEAFKITPKDIVKELGELPDNKIHCSVLGDKALRHAINDYYKKTGQMDKINEEKTKIICQCLSITDKDIEEAVLEGARNYPSLQDKTKIGTVCGQCKETSIQIMKKYIDHHFS